MTQDSEKKFRYAVDIVYQEEENGSLDIFERLNFSTEKGAREFCARQKNVPSVRHATYRGKI